MEGSVAARGRDRAFFGPGVFAICRCHEQAGNAEARRRDWRGHRARRDCPMTADVRRDVEAELSHADDALRAAEALLKLSIPNEAAGRIYYAVFHAARALLFSIGIAPKSHESLRT